MTDDSTPSLARDRRRHGYARIGLALLAASLVGGSGSVAHAISRAEYLCLAGRALAAGKYALCAHKVSARLLEVPVPNDYTIALGKCLAKYAATWGKLQSKAVGTGATCDAPRYTNHGDGTVTDRLTGLQWELKTNPDGVPNPSDPHDADNLYTWMSLASADGDAFTGFLRTLNDGACFAGHCDWRLPTRDELATTLSPPYPSCLAPPCLEPALGPAREGYYMSSTSWVAGEAFAAWAVNYGSGFVVTWFKTDLSPFRAVRGRL